MSVCFLLLGNMLDTDVPFREPRKGGFSKGGFCRVECHTQGNKKDPKMSGPAVHLAPRAPQPRETFTFVLLLKTSFFWLLTFPFLLYLHVICLFLVGSLCLAAGHSERCHSLHGLPCQRYQQRRAYSCANGTTG